MKRLRYSLLIVLPILAILFAVSYAEGFKYPKPDGMKFGSLEFEPREPTRMELDNGMILYLLENHELPLVEGYTFIKAGAVYDPEDKVSLARLTAEVMRTGGTKSMSGDEINDELEFNAAYVEVGAGDVSAYASFSTLTENLDRVIEIYADILMNPVFDEEKLVIAKERVEEEIRRQNDRPLQIAVREFFKQVTKGHPIGWYPTFESVGNIQRADLIDFHNRYYHPNNVILAVAGDFNTTQFVNKLNKVFSDWAKVTIDFPEIPDLELEYGRKVYYAEKDLTQSTIILGHVGIYQKDPIYYPFYVGNQILGSGMNSRLFKEVRTKTGLAYAVASFLSGGQHYRGIVAAYCLTKSSTTGQAIDLILDQFKKLREEEVSNEELQDAKDGIINRFVFQFTSALQIARNKAAIEYYELPSDYYDKYRNRIGEVTAEDILGVAKKYLRPDDIEIMVVGKEADFDKPLSSYGEVEKIKLE
jgi:zinc protease